MFFNTWYVNFFYAFSNELVVYYKKIDRSVGSSVLGLESSSINKKKMFNGSPMVDTH